MKHGVILFVVKTKSPRTTLGKPIEMRSNWPSRCERLTNAETTTSDVQFSRIRLSDWLHRRAHDIATSIALAQSALDEGIPFDVAVVDLHDLHLADGSASHLIQVLSELGIPVVITTGDKVDRGQPALSKAVAILQKPHTESDLIKAIIQTDVGVLCIRRGSLFPLYIAFAY